MLFGRNKTTQPMAPVPSVRPRMMHWYCNRCSTVWSVPMPASPGTPRLPDCHEKSICDYCLYKMGGTPVAQLPSGPCVDCE